MRVHKGQLYSGSRPYIVLAVLLLYAAYCQASCLYHSMPMASGLVQYYWHHVGRLFLCKGLLHWLYFNLIDLIQVNLSTISALLRFSESVTGVTFLAFGNGSVRQLSGL